MRSTSSPSESQRRRRALACAFAVAALASSCASGPQGNPPRRCLPEFPYADGWLGGDAAYSVPLPALEPEPTSVRRTLWLFGDSFVAPDSEEGATPTNRVGSTFVHNSIAISTCHGPAFKIEYAWGRDARGRPTAFFDSGDPDLYWWLFDGFVHKGALYVGLLEVAPAPPDDALGMPFSLRGMKLARIANPSSPPADWKMTIARLSHTDAAFPGAAMRVVGDHVLFFSFMAMRDGRQPRFMARMPVSALEPFPEDLSPALETLDTSGHWIAGFDPTRARLVMADNASEMSFAPHAGPGPAERWIAVYGSPIQTGTQGHPPPDASESPSRTVYARIASRPIGPWSARMRIFEIPRAEPPDPNRVCYAAKAHPQFSTPSALVVTYVCNLRTPPGEDPWPILGRLQRDMEIYRPEVVEIPLPEGGWTAPEGQAGPVR